MNRELREIQDWVGLARAAKYQSGALAKLCRCTLRQLELHFAQCGCKPPRAWLLEVRMWEAVRFLIEGQSVKEVSQNTGFKALAHFYHPFKQYHGCTPVKFLETHCQRESARKRQAKQLFRELTPEDLAALDLPFYTRA